MAQELVHWEVHQRAPLLPIVARASHSDINLAAWANEHRETIQERIERHGAILFRGFAVRQLSDFENFVDSILPERLSYMYRSTPRTAVGDRIFTATEYPRHATIPLHCENAYQREWPMKLLLYCVEPSPRGGETTLADNAKVTARIGPEIVEEFASRRVMYVRNYGHGVDIPWQTVFQTERREDVERYCHDNQIEFQWQGAEGLRTWQVCQGIATHPKTGQPLWFNQAHLFHVSSLEPRAREAMLSVFAEKDLPRNAYFGDGSPIPGKTLDLIRDAYRRETVPVRWEKYDVVVVDNMLAAHGRMPYSGARKVLVSMGESIRSPT
jgi:alpha-ketoglutarate-dependent taurine dioxygenase